MNRNYTWLLATAAVAGVGIYAVCNGPMRKGPGGAERLGQPNDQVQALIDDLNQKWDRQEKVAVKFKVSSPTAMGLDGETIGDGEYSYQKRDGHPFLRAKITNRLGFTMKKEDAPDSKLYTAEVFYYLFDGTYMWVAVAGHEYNKIRKLYYDPTEALQLGGPDLWAQLLDNTTIERLPDEPVEELAGRDAYVFSVKPRDGSGLLMQWFDKETGMRLKTVESDAKGVETLRIWITEIDLNPEFAEDEFVMPDLAGREVVDETVPSSSNDDRSQPESNGGDAP